MKARKQAARYSRSGLMIMLVLLLQYPVPVRSASEEQVRYPVYTPKLATMGIEEIRETLLARPRATLNRTEVLDLIIALAWNAEYEEALEAADERLAVATDGTERSSLYACIGMIRYLQARRIQVAAKSLSWWERHLSKQEFHEWLVAKHRAYLQQALDAVVKSCRYNPPPEQSKALAAFRIALAHKAGDPAALEAAADYLRETYPLAEGDQVMDPVTGIVIVVATGMVVTGWMFRYAAASGDNRLPPEQALKLLITMIAVSVKAISEVSK